MYHFHITTKEEKEKLIHYRNGETRIGQCIRSCEEINGDALNLPEIKFVMVGLPEDIGVRANYGLGGADSSWIPFLKSFLNIQETEFLSGNAFLLYGVLRKDAERLPNPSSIEDLRKQTAEIDDLVFPVIQKIIAAGKIPIVIGGGHNNAFPILKGAALAKGHSVNAINIDAHADFRAIEGRHSGNGFSYAFMQGYLKNYFALGLHEGYNSREMLQDMADAKEVKFLFWEDIFIRKKTDWTKAVQAGIQHVSNDFFGTEMDVDCIENVLSSAATPVGIQLREAMEALYQCGRTQGAMYLHIPETVAQRADGESNPLSGKVISYLVQSYTKGVLEKGE